MCAPTFSSSASARHRVLNEPSGAKTYASGINQSIYFLIDIKISSSNRELVVPNPKLILSNYLEV
jgi:hypothetical protein